MDLFSDSTRRDPYPLYAQLRTASPVFHLASRDLWLVLGYDQVKRVLHDHEVFSSDVAPARGINFQWLLFMDPPRHTKLRAIVNRAFTSRSIASLEPRIHQIASELLDAVRDRDEIDLVADLGTPLPMMVIAEMLGLPWSDWRLLARWSEAIIDLGNTISGVDAERASEVFVACDLEMTSYFTEQLRARRASPRDDLISRLANAEVDGERLDDRELVRFCQLLLAAGTETTTNLIDNATLCLIDQPEALARLQTDPAVLPGAIEEALRFRTPIQAMFRTARVAVDLAGVQVPAGAFLIASIGAANRDPAQFASPDRFDITRAPNPHLAFGHGIHFCLGAPLSRLEARIALSELLTRFSAFELLTPAWTPRAAFHVHGPRTLPLRVTRA